MGNAFDRIEDSKYDNARKFIVQQQIGLEFLASKKATLSFLIIDWIATDETREEKLVCKLHTSGRVEYKSTMKEWRADSRSKLERQLKFSEYEELRTRSLLRLEKARYEFGVEQDNLGFFVKYDEFVASPLRILEVDAYHPEQRAAFDPSRFGYSLSEVTGSRRYYGHMVAHEI